MKDAHLDAQSSHGAHHVSNVRARFPVLIEWEVRLEYQKERQQHTHGGVKQKRTPSRNLHAKAIHETLNPCSRKRHLAVHPGSDNNKRLDNRKWSMNQSEREVRLTERISESCEYCKSFGQSVCRLANVLAAGLWSRVNPSAIKRHAVGGESLSLCPAYLPSLLLCA